MNKLWFRIALMILVRIRSGFRPAASVLPGNGLTCKFLGHTPALLNGKHSSLCLSSPPGEYAAHSRTSGSEEKYTCLSYESSDET